MSLLLFFLPILFIAGNNYAQGCCGFGGALVSGGHPVLNRNVFLTNVSGNYSEAENPERYRGGVGVLFAYGITDRLALSLKTSFVRAKASIYRSPIQLSDEIVLPGETINFLNNDFSDGYAAFQYALIRLTPMNKHELIVGLDVGIPWGPDRKAKDGVVLPGNVQTGSGAFSVNGFLTYLKAFPERYFSAASTIAGRITFKTPRGKDLGDEYSAMVTSLFGPFYSIRGSLSLNYYSIGTTYSELNLPETGTSGNRLSILPAIEYSIFHDLKVVMSAELPLWRDNNQSLYGNNKAVTFEAYWFIRHKEDDSRRMEEMDF